ncbi:MAG: hypothetical protein EA397_08170 [Deltaproteobacteria bacterium]|nr:MAG: hypothetical protein EA397_08170 [Deltaproteobacteria bacterium]
MQEPSVARLSLRGALSCLAVGALVGGLETLPLAARVKLALGPLDLVVLGLLSAAMYAAFAGAVGLLLGLAVHTAMKRIVISRGLAVQLALTTGLTLLLLFSGLASQAWAEDRAVVAALLLFMPLLLTLTAFLLGSRLYQEDRSGLSAELLSALSGVGGFGLLLAGSLLLRSAQPMGGAALDSDPRFVVIVVDSLRADLGAAPVPNLDRIASSGVVFSSAITPSPDTAPAVASISAGLYPLRHEVLRGGDRLRRVEALLPATFSEEGYATGGFVSTSDLSYRSGFDYGYQIYDDEAPSRLAGLSRLRIPELVFDLLGRGPRPRPDAQTVDRFLSWLDGVADRPFFAMVHLHGPREPFEPHGLEGFEANGQVGAPSIDHRSRLDETFDKPADVRSLKRLYREEVVAADLQIGRILDALQARRLADNTVVVVVGTGGVLLGEHGGRFTHRGLYEANVKVPMLISIPRGPRDRVVRADVRLQDLYATLLAHAEIRPRHESESIVLLPYLGGERDLDLSTVLVGRDQNDVWWIGLRSNDLKYLVPVEGGDGLLFELDEDPTEQRDVSTQMPDTASKAAQALAAEQLRLRRILKLSSP